MKPYEISLGDKFELFGREYKVNRISTLRLLFSAISREGASTVEFSMDHCQYLKWIAPKPTITREAAEVIKEYVISGAPRDSELFAYIDAMVENK